jgi:hypothetical protein
MKKPRVKKSREVWDWIDPSKKVRVYRNLHKNCFSVKQNGLVCCHTNQVTLSDCKFIVSKAGQKRVRDEKRKNVHAFVEGFVVDTREADKVVDGAKSDKEIFDGWSEWTPVYYNPYQCDGFSRVTVGNTITEEIVESAKFADFESSDTTVLTFSPKFVRLQRLMPDW